MLKPGDRGTRKLLEHFGERLVCVRYRQDPAQESILTRISHKFLKLMLI